MLLGGLQLDQSEQLEVECLERGGTHFKFDSSIMTLLLPLVIRIVTHLYLIINSLCHLGYHC